MNQLFTVYPLSAGKRGLLLPRKFHIKVLNPEVKAVQ